MVYWHWAQGNSFLCKDGNDHRKVYPSFFLRNEGCACASSALPLFCYSFSYSFTYFMFLCLGIGYLFSQKRNYFGATRHSWSLNTSRWQNRCDCWLGSPVWLLNLNTFQYTCMHVDMPTAMLYYLYIFVGIITKIQHVLVYILGASQACMS